MKTQIFFSHFIATSFVLLLLFACRSELDGTNAQNEETLPTSSSKMMSKLISVKNLNNKIQNWEQVIASLQKFKKKEFAKLQSNSNIFYREIIDSQNNIITYTLPLTSYSSQNPFYLIQQIIVPQNGQQRIQYLKIIPNKPPQYITQDVLKTLTGSIERLDQNLMLLNSTTYENGKVVKTGNGSTSGKNLCIEVTEVIEVPCTNGGNHGVGESCGKGFTNNAHFVETTYTVCLPGGSEGTNPVPVPGGGIEGGYVFDEQLNSLLTNPTFQYADYITEPSRNLLLQAVRAWIPNNVNNINGDLTDLNNRLQYFINNDQIFTNLAIYDQNTPNVANAELADYSVRVYEMIKFLLNNPSEANGKFGSFGVKFLDENRFVAWDQFRNWFFKQNGETKITFNNINTSNKLNLNNMVEFKNYITSFKNSFTPDASSLENSANNTKITKFKAKFDILAPVYLNIHAKSTLENPNTYATEFDLLEVNSFKSGISAFLTWNQDSYGHSVDGHVVEINLNGHFDIGVKIGDLDFTYADSYIIKAKYNNITGNAMSISGTPD